MSDTRSDYDLKRTWGRIGWFVAIAIVVLAGAALLSGRGFSLGVGGESGPQLNVAAGGIGEALDPNELEDLQPELEAQAAAAQESLAQQPSAAQAATVDLSGFWGSVAGYTYQIVQVGSAASITETDQFGFITAYGEGVVDGVTFDFNFTTAAFTTGSGSLSVDGSGTVLVGTFSDAFGSRPAELRR